MKIKQLMKKSLTLLMTASMAISAVVSGGMLTGITAHAAGDKELPSAWGVSGGSEGTGIDAPVPRNVFQLIKSQKVTPTYSSSTLKKLDSSDDAYQWVKNMEEAAGEWDSLKGGGIYGAKLQPNTEYSVSYNGVTLDDGHKVDVKIAVVDCGKKASWGNDADGHGDNGGPYIVFFGSVPGAIRYSVYTKVKCRISVTDHNSTSLSQDVASVWNFMDIDQRQALEVNASDVKMITGGVMGESLTLASNSTSYSKHIEYHMGGNPAYTVYSTENGNASDTAGQKKFRLNLDIKFTEADHDFVYWFYAGHQTTVSEGCPSGAGGCDEANQKYGVYMFFGGTEMDTKDTPPFPPSLTKKVNGAEKYTLKDGGEEFTYSLSFDSNGWADNLTKVTLTDTLDKCLSYAGGFSVNSSAAGNITSYFTDQSSGQDIKFVTSSASNAAKIGGTAATYTVSFKAKVNWKDADLASHGHLSSHANSGYDGYAEIPNKAKIRIAASGVEYDEGQDTAESETVHVYYKPEARPDPTKSVDKETLNHADETWTYKVSQKVPANSYGTGMKEFAFTDQIDPCLKIDSVKLYQDPGGKDVTDHFAVTVENNRITAKANAATLGSDFLTGNGGAKEFYMLVKVRYYHTSDEDSYGNHRLQDIVKHTGTLTDGKTYSHLDNAESAVTARNNAKVSVKFSSWGDGWNGEKTTNTVTTTAPVPTMEKPEKTVTDQDEKDVQKNKLANADEGFTYTITQKIPENVASIYRYNSFYITDQIDTCLTIGKAEAPDKDAVSLIGVMINGEDKKDQFDVTVKDNLVTVSAKPGLLQGGSDNLLYGGKGLSGSTIKVTIPVYIDSSGNEGGADAANAEKLAGIRAHGHMHVNDAGNEDYMIFDNVAATYFDDMVKRTPEKLETGKTTTQVGCPQLPDPVKNVYDGDDLDWDYKVGEGNESDYKDRTQNRLTGASEIWNYVLTQKLPAHTAPLFYYKSFYVEDPVDACLTYDVGDIVIRLGGKEYASSDKWDGYFTVEKSESNVLKVSATDKALKDAGFYGEKEKGNDLVIDIPVRINQELDGLSYVTETLKQHGHLVGEAGTYKYRFFNSASTSVDNLLKVSGKEGQHVYETAKNYEGGTVRTEVEVSEPEVSKESSKFEWQVGDQVDYMIVMGNENKESIADNVIITDADLPPSLLPDVGSIRLESSLASEEDKEKAGAPKDRDIMKDSDVQYTDKGFVITIPKLYRNETATVTLTCTAKEKAAFDWLTQWQDCLTKDGPEKVLTCVNGEVVDNTASVTATLMLPDEPVEDEERVWVNTPHLKIEKSAEKKEYGVGEVVKYTLVVTNTHEGTLARDLVITDHIETDSVSIVEGSIHLKDETGSSYSLGKKAGKEADTPYLVSMDDRSFTITTGMNLRHDGESPFEMADKINDRVHNLKFEGISQEEWDSPLTHTRFTVTYEAKITKEPENTDQIINVATAEGSNTEEVSDPENVYLKSPLITMDKESDKASYMPGEIGEYHLTVTQTREDRTAVNVVVTDGIDKKDLEKGNIQTDTIKVYFNGKEFTPVSITADEKSFLIETGKDLTVKDKLEVTYDMLFTDAMQGESLANTAKAKADNAYAEVELDVPMTQVTQNLSARKRSNPASGIIVKNKDEVIYYIDVRNDSGQTVKDVMVRDQIPELTSYVDGSANYEGQLRQIGGKDYITYVIPVLKAGETQTLTFAVTVHNASADDVILNTAEVRETDPEDLNEDGSVKEEAWDSEEFKPTNTTKHPLSNWAVDTNQVKMGIPDVDIRKQADSGVAEVGDTIHWTIDVEQTMENGKVTNLVVEDKGLPKGVEILYDSIRVDGKSVEQKESMDRNAAKIHMVKTDGGFKVIYPELAGKSQITFDSKVTSEKLKGKKVKNTATAISDQTPLKKAHAAVKIPKNILQKVVEKAKEKTIGPKGVKTGVKSHAALFAGIAALLLGGAVFVWRQRKKKNAMEKF